MSRVRGANQSMFARAPRVEIQRSQFRRDFTHKTTFNTTWLYPIFVDEVLPGDTFNMKLTAFARMSTPIFPIMDNLYMDTFFFFIPNRLVWNDWEKFCSQDPESDSVLVPQVSLTQANWLSGDGAIYRYFGIPDPGTVDPIRFSALYFRAYNLIWNEWYRDQNLQPVLAPVKKDSTDDLWTNYFLLPRNKRHDYFTSALPWPQKGVAPGLTIGGGTYNLNITTKPGQPFTLFPESAGVGQNRYTVFGSTGLEYQSGTDISGQPAYYYDGIAGNVTVNAASFSINDLRVAFQLQTMQEKDARGGSRYTELIFSHFGVISPDARLQRPEYLGGSTTPIVITPIAQTAASSGSTTPLATLAAMGTANFQTRWIKSFTEHGMIIGLVHVRADLTYQQGIERMWLRLRREDFYWPSLANIGEQAIMRQEIYAKVSAAERVLGFGFQERYAEYRYKPSMITGEFQSGYAGALDAWHLSQYFSTQPVLNSSFIIDSPPVNRVLATGNTAPYFLFDSLFSLVCARPMPMFSVPMSIGRF